MPSSITITDVNGTDVTNSGNSYTISGTDLELAGDMSVGGSGSNPVIVQCFFYLTNRTCNVGPEVQYSRSATTWDDYDFLGVSPTSSSAPGYLFVELYDTVQVGMNFVKGERIATPYGPVRLVVTAGP